MKNAYPVVTAASSSPVDPDSNNETSKNCEDQTAPIIRLKLDKPLHWDWELTTTADTVPVIQLLDRDGKLLVETTGKTAQRARGSFREGLTTYEEFPNITRSISVTSKPEPLRTGNRNMDGFSNKFGSVEFGFKPRKSRSDANIKFISNDKKIKCKQNKQSDKMSPGQPVNTKKYSTGDFLRRQILDDLRTRSTLGKTPDEVAKERCRKVKAYLRSQSDLLPGIVNSENDFEVENHCLGSKIDLNDQEEKDQEVEEYSSTLENNSLESKEHALLSSVPLVDGKVVVVPVDPVKLVRIRSFLTDKLRERMEREEADDRLPINKRHSDCSYRQNKKDGGDYRRRKVRSETNVIKYLPGDHLNEDNLSPSLIDQLEYDKDVRDNKKENGDDQTTMANVNYHSSFSSSSLYVPTIIRKNKNYHRSKSDVLLTTTQSINDFELKKNKTKSTDRRRTYRKTKSDLLFFDDPYEESKKDLDRIERSWRDYKERKKLEKLQRDTEPKKEQDKEINEKDWKQEKDEKQQQEEDEVDLTGKTKWRKDFQSELCGARNCKICQNLRISLNHPSETETKVYSFGIDSDKDHSIQLENNNNNNNNLQSSSTIVSPDFGYNSIPKSVFKDYRELYARSNVKKSDTFKIIDGSEDGYEETLVEDNTDDNERRHKDENSAEMISLANKSNEDIARDYFKRVYELLKKRQEEARKIAEKRDVHGYDDSSSSNYVEEVRRRKHRRRKRDTAHGEELVTVSPSNGGQQQEGWKVQQQHQQHQLQQQQQQQRRGQLQTVNKRTRPSPPVPPPPPLISCKVNAKDIGKYFDWPNKENTTPGNALNHIPSNNCNNKKGKVFDKKDQEKGEEEEVEEEQEEKEVVEGQGEENQKEKEEEEEEEKESINEMGSNLSRHNGKGLTGRRTQSSGNLCEPPKGKFNGMGKILVPCSSSSQRESRYKFCGSLPNHLDDKDVLDDERRENNNIMSDTISGNLGGTLPHKKRSLGVHFSDSGPTGALDLVKHRSQDSLDENDPWRYQQSDLDLVRCRHGNFDSVRRNRSIETMINETSRRYNGRGTSSMDDRCQRNSDLDLVGTLPKRKQELRSSILNKSLDTTINSSCGSQFVGQKFDVSSSDDDLLMRIVHKPDCELVKHRQQLNKCVDIKLNKLVGATGEPQDQGYASERSPEDEHPPSLPGQPFPSVTPESTFRVTLQKSSRGLGLSVSGGGTAGPVRVKRLFPLQPAALSNKLQPGDILLAANGIPLTGLTNYEALEVLRTTPNTVELVVCRLPGDTNVSPPGAPPPPPARREPPPPLRIPNPLPPLQIEPCGEFDIEMLKVGGSLGFTLRKADSSALGHYVRALVREPALSDGRIRPGDKIVAVDGAPLSPMSHEEAVALLRQCGPKVKLRLYRDLAQTPVSALSPTEPDHPLRPPRTCLRQEAVDMLCDLAARKLSPGTSSGSSCLQSPGASCNSPRRHRRLATRTPTADNDQEIPEKFHEGQTTSIGSQAETSDSDQCSIRTQITNSQANTPISNTDIIIDPPSQYHVCEANESPLRTPTRPSFLDLSAPHGKPHFQFCSADSDDYPVETMLFSEKDSSSFENDYRGKEIRGLSSDEQDTDLPSEPASMPPVLSSTSSTSTAAFSYKNPAYQSANPACGVTIDTASKSKVTHSSDQDIPGKILGTEDPAGSKGLLKWKGVMFAPNDDMNENEKDENKVDDDNKDTLDSAVSSENQDEQGNEVFMVELTRGWNSRLGFSLKSEDNQTVISVVHPDSVAARDGRLRQGDVLLMVNDESVENMTTAEIIDLLRKIRGSIGITVMRRSKQENNAT